jgi:hypothetical protein
MSGCYGSQRNNRFFLSVLLQLNNPQSRAILSFFCLCIAQTPTSAINAVWLKVTPAIFGVLALFGGSFFTETAHAWASVTISNTAVDEIEKTLSLTVSGVSGSSSPAFVVSSIILLIDAGTRFYVVTSAASGTVTAPIDESLKDTDGDTSIGQTGVWMTNDRIRSRSRRPFFSRRKSLKAHRFVQNRPVAIPKRCT